MPAKPAPKFVSTLVSQGQARIVWSDDVKAQVLPFRADRPKLDLDAAALWKEAGTAVAAYWKENRAYFTKDKKSDRTKEWMAAYEELVERLDSPKPILPLRVDEEGAHWAVTHSEDVVAKYWLALMDAEFAVRAFVRAWSWDPWGHRIPIGDMSPRDHDREWQCLRAALMSVSDAEWNKAKRAAENFRATGHLTLKCVLSFVFDEPEWATADATEWLDGIESKRTDLGRGPQYGACLIAVLRDLALLESVVKALKKQRFYAMGGYPSSVTYVPTMLAQHGAAVVPLLGVLLDGSAAEREGPTAELAKIVACVESADAAQMLVKHLEHKAVRPIVIAYAERFSEVAKTALAEAASGRAKNADAAKALLRKFDGAGPSAPEASEKDLPKVLASPPWLAKRKAKPKPTVEGLESLSFKETIEWEKGEKEAALQPGIDVELLRNWGEIPKDGKLRTKKVDEHVLEKLDKAKGGDDWFARVHFVAGMLDAMTDEGALAAWNDYPPKAWDPNDSDFAYVIARFGWDAFKGLLAAAETWPQKGVPELARLVSPRIAPLMADAATRLKKVAPVARKWLEEHPEPAAIALIPRALSGKDRDAASSALRMMDNAVVEKVAGRYGKAARAAIDEILSFDLLDDFPAKIRKLPAWFDAGTITSPVLAKGGKALPKVAIERIATMLAFSPAEPYAGIEIVKDACERRSLAEMAWEIFLAWNLAGSPSKEDWALAQLGIFGDDDCARRLAPRIREWPGESAHARAVKGLDVLAAIGTDVALMHLDGIAQKVKFKGLQEKAREKIAAVAESRGLSREELGDRLVPDLDLEPDGSKTIGGVKIKFDEKLVPYTDEKKPPKEIQAELKILKKDAKTIAQNLLMRIERAMCMRRRWDTESFREFFIEPPLVHQVIRRLILGIYDGAKLKTTFRVAEDRTFADAKDEAWMLPKAAEIGIVHRLELDDAALGKWGHVFGDYELIAPFAQIDRETFTPDANEKRSSTSKRFEKTNVKLGQVLGLENRGWRRGMPQDAGWIWDMIKPITGDLEAVLDLKGGILAGDMRESPADQELGTLHLRDTGSWKESSKTFGALDPILVSELFRDVATMTA